MREQDRKEILDNLKNKKQGEAVREFIEKKIEELKQESIKNAETMEDVKGTRNAIVKMKELLRRLKLSKNNKDKKFPYQ